MSLVIESDSPSDDLVQKQGNLEYELIAYVFARDSSRQMQIGHSTTNIIRDLEAGLELKKSPRSTIEK